MSLAEEGSQAFSHYPAIPAPGRRPLTQIPDHDCSYLAGKSARFQAFWTAWISPEEYHAYMDAGFRRSGSVIYQPICTACRLCQPIRVPVATFVPSKSQRRSATKNRDISVSIHEPEPNKEKYVLYSRYLKQWHGTNRPEGEDSEESFLAFLYESPVDTLEFEYRTSAGRLLGVGIVDQCSQSFSSVYFYFDPDESDRGLGTYSALCEIEEAKRRGISYYYLGYWVSGCGSMEYKSRFRPFQLLGADGVWR